ncbi:glycosyltransferase [Desulfosediminicola flagellatus]|uniref:glycosyltransferase n=1 Tax=Desulfosediminicola flagellatus TaxID=2569541 RepID=UPI0010AC6F56|nr:glycosyltransferase [Desulfosediminicola flagellatus]
MEYNDYKRIKVLHVVLSLKIGGLEKFVIDLMHHHLSSIDSHVVCLETLGAFGEQHAGFPVLVLDKKPGVKLNCALAIQKYANANNIDVIHTHNEGAHFYGAIGGFLSKVPVIHTRHGVHDFTSTQSKLLERFSSMLSERVVGVSKDISDLYINSLNLDANKVATILNGVDTDIFSARSCNRQEILLANIENDVILIGIVARLAPVKDHKTLFTACDLLSQSYSKFKLVVVGGGPEENTLRQLSTELEMEDRIIFLGPRYDVSVILNCIDIFVLSSKSEGISITLLEAMASGLPVVATDVGGNPEVVIDGETGILTPPEDPESFAEQLLKLLQSRELRDAYGLAGRQRVLDKFSIRRSAKEYEALYRSMLKGTV